MGRMDGQTDGQTDGWTDRWKRLKQIATSNNESTSMPQEFDEYFRSLSDTNDPF